MNAATTAARRAAHGLQSILLAFPIALFCGAVASDLAYLKTAEMQWSNFSAWMLAGGVLFGGFVLAWAIVGVAFALRGGRMTRALLYLAVVAAMWIAGLVNTFQHSRDAWSSVGAFGLTLSVISAGLALIAGGLLYSRETLQEGVR